MCFNWLEFLPFYKKSELKPIRANGLKAAAANSHENKYSRLKIEQSFHGSSEQTVTHKGNSQESGCV